MNRSRLLVAAVTMLTVGTALPGTARAQSYSFSFNGSGVAGALMLNYGAVTDAKYPGAYEVTGISGFFSDMNNGLTLMNVPVGALVPINHAMPETLNLLAPKDFSRFAVASGLPPQSGGFSTFDNLFWPGGSPQTASDYDGHGGFLDIYGLFFSIGNGRMVNIWSNGVGNNGMIDYGASVVTASAALDYAGSGVTATSTPEPATLWLVGSGLVGLLVLRRRSRAA